MTYKFLPKNEEGNERKFVQKNGVFIPFDEANTDYQEYLEWVAEGNTAEEAD